MSNGEKGTIASGVSSSTGDSVSDGGRHCCWRRCRAWFCLAMARFPFRLVLLLIVIQLLIATFVAITMMGWWFAGRTLLTVLPLLVLPLVLLVARTPPWGRVVVVILGAMTLATTYGLAMAGRTGEVTIAVDPFDMSYPLFHELAGLFPLYTRWTVETWWLTYFWWAVAAVATGATVWPEIRRRRPPTPFSVQLRTMLWRRFGPFTQQLGRDCLGSQFRLNQFPSLELRQWNTRRRTRVAILVAPEVQGPQKPEKLFAQRSCFAQLLFALYHSTVRRMPSSMSTDGAHPNRSCARVVSAHVIIGSAGWRS